MTPIEIAANNWNAATEALPYYKAPNPLNTPGTHNFTDDIAPCNFGTSQSQTDEQRANFDLYLSLLDEEYKRTVARNWFASLDVPNVFYQSPPADQSHPLDSVPTGTVITKTDSGITVQHPSGEVTHHSKFSDFLKHLWAKLHGLHL